jgi:hypothetical protein
MLMNAENAVVVSFGLLFAVGMVGFCPIDEACNNASDLLIFGDVSVHIILPGTSFRLEHFEHPLGDEEAADDVDRAN